MTIQTIINNAVKRLKAEGKLLTPDYYAEAFCKEASRAKMNTTDCSHIDDFTQMLNKDMQKELKNYRIKTVAEFVRFLISKLNRSNSTVCSQTLEAQTILTKRILQVVEVLHNQEASELAKKTIELLNGVATPQSIDEFRQRWVNFITTYDDTFLQKLKELGDVDEHNLKKTIENLNITASILQEPTSKADLQKISQLLVASLTPSIASSVNDDIAQLSSKIMKDPSILESTSVESEIKSAISLRIALDKNSVKEMIESIDGVLDKLSLRLIDMIEKSDSSNVEVQAIKKELEAYSEGNVSNFKLAHKKLFTIVVALEKNTKLLSSGLKDHSDEVGELSKKVKELEKELQKVKAESKEDFLTKMYNKRALDEFIAFKESEFQRYNKNYSVVMFDIDFFKKVNDTFGHEAGDAVLRAFAKILKKECRDVDIVGRFGGEEFLALLGSTDAKGGYIFAQKVREHVQKAKFMYKGQRIKVTISGGVSERAKHSSIQAAISNADECLYKAKQTGRNKIVYR